jgi:hypothetical protein
MNASLTVRDETTVGQTLHEFALELLTERHIVRKLIRSRIYQAVQDCNLRQPEQFRGLVQPTDADQTLNGFKLNQPRQIDSKKQFALALEAFEVNRFLILVDD